MSYQKVIIVGFLGRDPEMRYLSDGTPVTSFSVATNRVWNSPDGSKNEETTWFRISVWRRQAEIAAQYLSKGRQVLIEGTLTPDKATGGPRTWTGQDGVVRAGYDIRGDRVVFLQGGGSSASPRSGGGGSDEMGGPGYTPEDEIPF